MVEIVGLPAFSDNYLWLIRCGDTQAIAVDPGDAEVIEAALQGSATHAAAKLAAILLTHHHGDHTGGVAALAARYACPVYGPAAEAIAGVTHPLHHGDTVDLLGLHFEVLAVPGHTRGHIAYWCADRQALFCGDTLFGAGCGRLFEGSPAQMWQSLSRLAVLPDPTRVYCAHEYTLANLRFARQADPDNAELARREQHDTATRAAGQPTIPSTIAKEKATNPFLRAGLPALAGQAERMAGRPDIAAQLPKLAELHGAVRSFAILRAWKNVS